MMSFLMVVSDFIIPVTVLVVVLFGCLKKVDIYDAFIEGAKEGLGTVVDILPTLIGLMMAVSVLRASGALEIVTMLLRPIADVLDFPAELVPLTMMRLVSSAASTGLLMDLYQNFGPDSFLGRLASVMMSCTETVFYTMSVYFMSVGIRKTRYALTGALVANVVGVVAAYFVTMAVFGR